MRRIDNNRESGGRSVLRLAALTLICGLAISVSATADAAVAYVRSTVGQPWGQNTNEQAMDMVFGAGAWDDLRYETLDPLVVFSPAYTFIYMEGGDTNAFEMNAFITANITTIEAWANAGGHLFMNAAPNEGGPMNWGFGGVVLNYSDSSSNPGSAVDPTHPMWLGPFTPVATSFTGSAFAHATVSGPGAIPHITDAGGKVHLIEMTYGNGRMFFGGLTTSNFWTPTAESLNLRANMLNYLALSCGDGVVAGFEQCDDGNTIDNDDCTNACTVAACGDGVVWDQGMGGEACDDGNVVDNDDCTNACTAATCGDGIVWDLENGAETCDDGNAIDNDDCTNTCLDAVCGDSVVWDLGNGTEECDDGNLVDDDMCTNTCIRNAYCGDGATDPGEECDDGAANSYDPGVCRPNCVAPFCGDAITDPNEQCDQGINNNNSPDACRPDCAAPTCGDGVIDVAGGEECDDGPANGAGGACEATCLLAPESGGGCCSTHDAPAPGLEFLWFGLLLFFVVRRRRVDA